MKGRCCLFSLLIILAMTFVFPTWNAVAALEGLVFYLSFEEQGNLIDHSPDPADVSIIGDLKQVNGKFGKALEFDGNVENHISVADSDKLSGMNAMTIEAWIMPYVPDPILPGAFAIISKRIDFEQEDSFNLFFTNGKIVGRINSQANVPVTSQTVMEDKVWHHLAYVFDGGAAEGERQKLYVDGVLEATVSHPHESVKKTDVPLWVGIFNAFNRSEGPWTGVLDEVRMWNRALGEDEIKLYMDGGLITSVRPQMKLATRWGDIKAK